MDCGDGEGEARDLLGGISRFPGFVFDESMRGLAGFDWLDEHVDVHVS